VSGLLVLWDVDYTLIDAAGIGRHLYELAFTELYGRVMPASAWTTVAGRTDRAIALDVLELAGLVAERAIALPGAAAAVRALAAAGTAIPAAVPVRQSVLTGNIRPLAEVKLAALGPVLRHLDLAVGAFGDEHEVRAELVPVARAKAARAYRTGFGGQATVLVGDTPLDIEAALLTGARAVGVATGPYRAAELAAAGAHAVLPDLADLAAVLAAILGGPPAHHGP
jgi:phosphoglycolate phosphatase